MRSVKPGAGGAVRAFCIAAAAVGSAILSGVAQVPARDPLPVPDLPGYQTLKGDFHLHTVFSDGEVWPDVHVREAWRDGLDVIALTDHADYHPHERYVTVDNALPHALASPLAAQLGIILIPGVEITHTALPDDEHHEGPSAHFNALFVTDPDVLNVPDDLEEALRRARAQDAFVFWNHPGHRTAGARWLPRIAALHEDGLFQGIELVNGRRFYPEAFPWIEERQLTILAHSDNHYPLPPRAVHGVRPVTLIFARTRDAAGVRDALLARRTAAWMGGRLWGAEEHLRGLWEGAVTVESADLTVTRYFSYLNLRNTSAIPFEIRMHGGPEWIDIRSGTLAPEGISSFYVETWPLPPAGVTPVEVELELTNVHVAPDRRLLVRVPVRIHLTEDEGRGSGR